MRAGRRSCSSALLAIALLAAPAAAQGPGLVAMSGNMVPGSTPLERTKSYEKIYAAGVRAVRIDIPWVEVEPQRGEFDFARVEAEVAAIRGAGLKVIGILAYGHPEYSTLGGAMDDSPTRGDGIPPFYVGSDQYFPPDDPADFARYAETTAAHLGNDVIAWEVWNEQNGGWRFWAPHEDPEAYAELLCETYPRVKAKDPTTPVLFGGVFFPEVPPGLPGQGGPQFVRNAYAADPDLGDCYDAMAYHPYPYPFTAPELDVPLRGSVLSAAEQMRAAMPDEDREKPLWITEVGWPTHSRSYGVNETKQAQYVARMQIATFAQGVPVVTWYTYGDGEDPSRGFNQEAWFGFFRTDGSAKPALRALATFSEVFAGSSFAADLSDHAVFPPRTDIVGGRRFAYEYLAPDRRIVAVWYANESVLEGQGGAPDGGTLTGATVPAEVAVSASPVTVIDHLGNIRRVPAVDGEVRLDAGPGPQYVVEPR